MSALQLEFHFMREVETIKVNAFGNEVDKNAYDPCRMTWEEYERNEVQRETTETAAREAQQGIQEFLKCTENSVRR